MTTWRMIVKITMRLCRKQKKEDVMETVFYKLPNRNKLFESLKDKAVRELWRQLEGKLSADSKILCEELRLILEATYKSGLGGRFLSGKRPNIRKVIELVASDFRKDQIWMRLENAEQRMYYLMLGIDKYASMGQVELY